MLGIASFVRSILGLGLFFVGPVFFFFPPPISILGPFFFPKDPYASPW